MKKISKRYAIIKLNADETSILKQACSILNELRDFINENEHQVQADEELENIIDDIYALSEDIDFENVIRR